MTKREREERAKQSWRESERERGEEEVELQRGSEQRKEEA